VVGRYDISPLPFYPFEPDGALVLRRVVPPALVVTGVFVRGARVDRDDDVRVAVAAGAVADRDLVVLSCADASPPPFAATPNRTAPITASAPTRLRRPRRLRTCLRVLMS
jgi:hypothetical protein